MNDTLRFAAQDADLADIKVQGFAGDLDPTQAKYLLISKGPSSFAFHPLLIIKAPKPSPVCRLEGNSKFLVPIMFQKIETVESKLFSLLSTYPLPAYSVDTTHALDNIAHGLIPLDLNGYPQADLVNKLFYSMRHLRQKQN